MVRWVDAVLTGMGRRTAPILGMDANGGTGCPQGRVVVLCKCSGEGGGKEARWPTRLRPHYMQFETTRWNTCPTYFDARGHSNMNHSALPVDLANGVSKVWGMTTAAGSGCR